MRGFARLADMTISADLAAKGVVRRLTPADPLADAGRLVAFCPLNTNYEIHATAPAGLDVCSGHVRAIVRIRARKLYTMPSGGGFVQPVMGSPRIVQGRVLSLDERELVVRAGSATFVVELPTVQDAIDLHTGEIAVNSLVNVVAFPGATLDVL